MGIRSGAATAAGRVVHALLHGVLHRTGAQLPGRVALAIDPQVVAHLRRKLRTGSVVVCGTNGKTTTTNLIAASLEAAGLSVLCNRDGANMLPGAASALLPRHAADWAVVEADELSTIHILPQLRPDYLVLLNLFRDQLDRAGEIDHVQDVIVEALSATPETTLLVCGDDPLCMGVATRAQESACQPIACPRRASANAAAPSWPTPTAATRSWAPSAALAAALRGRRSTIGRRACAWAKGA